NPQPSPQEAPRGWPGRLRAQRAVGLLLRSPRRDEGAIGMAEVVDDTTVIRERVRERYAAAAKAATESRSTGCGCGGTAAAQADEHGRHVFGGSLYGSEAEAAPEAAVAASLGCGVPTAVAELREGETVLDLGSGAGIDVLLSARRVGPAGLGYGLDMTDEMREPGRRTAGDAGGEHHRLGKGGRGAVP